MTAIIIAFLLIVPAIVFISHFVGATFPLRDEEAYQLWKFDANTTDIKTTHKTSNFSKNLNL